MKRHKTEIETDEYVFFWKGILSQWRKTNFKDSEGVRYNTCEQYMMAHKAKLFNDEPVLKEIMSTDDPRKQKSLGRSVQNYNDEVWSKVAKEIVFEGNLFRFKSDELFANALLATGDKIIVEASPFDRRWGIGFYADEALKNKNKWGDNWLGEVLMSVRDVKM